MDQVKHCTVRIERLPLPPCWVLVERYEPPILISEPWTLSKEEREIFGYPPQEETTERPEIDLATPPRQKNWTIDDLITPPPSPPQDLDDDPIARQLASMGA